MVRFSLLLGITCLAAAALFGTTKEPDPIPVSFVVSEPTPAVGQPQPAETAIVAPAEKRPEASPVVVPVSAPNVPDEPAVEAFGGVCVCKSDCCKCDPSLVPHYWYQGKWHPCKLMKAGDAERENAKYAAPVRQQPQPVKQAPTYYTMPMQSGGCAGQCGTGGFSGRGWFGRR